MTVQVFCSLRKEATIFIFLCTPTSILGSEVFFLFETVKSDCHLQVLGTFTCILNARRISSGHNSRLNTHKNSLKILNMYVGGNHIFEIQNFLDSPFEDRVRTDVVQKMYK